MTTLVGASIAGSVAAQMMRRPDGTWGDEVYLEPPEALFGGPEVLTALLVALGLALALAAWQLARALALRRGVTAWLDAARRPEPDELVDLRSDVAGHGRLLHPLSLVATLGLALTTMVLGRRQIVGGIEIPLLALLLAAAAALFGVAAAAVLDDLRRRLAPPIS